MYTEFKGFFLPNWSILVDFCHHFLSSTHRPIVSNFPESVVLDHVALSKSDTSSTLVELLTLCKTEVSLPLEANCRRVLSSSEEMVGH